MFCWGREAHLVWVFRILEKKYGHAYTNTRWSSLNPELILVFYFQYFILPSVCILPLVCSLQSAFYPWSAVCILPLVCSLQSAVCSLRFTLTGSPVGRKTAVSSRPPARKSLVRRKTSIKRRLGASLVLCRLTNKTSLISSLSFFFEQRTVRRDFAREKLNTCLRCIKNNLQDHKYVTPRHKPVTCFVWLSRVFTSTITFSGENKKDHRQLDWKWYFHLICIISMPDVEWLVFYLSCLLHEVETFVCPTRPSLAPSKTIKTLGMVGGGGGLLP